MKHTGDSSASLMRTETEKNTEKDRSPELTLTSESSPVIEHMGCGFGRCQPRFLQIFARPFVFMIILNIYCLVEGAIVSGKLTSVAMRICNRSVILSSDFQKHVSAIFNKYSKCYHTPKHGYCLYTAPQDGDQHIITVFVVNSSVQLSVLLQ